MNNPLSPHLQIYRWQITSVLSILHRITGIVLSLGTIILSVWLLCLGLGEYYFDFWLHVVSLFSYTERHQTFRLGLWFWFGFIDCQSDRMDGNCWFISNDYYNMVFISFMSNSGRKTWLFQKYSSIALIPLVSYFLVKILQLSSMTYEQIVSETSSLWFLVLVLIFAVIGLLHMRLSLI